MILTITRRYACHPPTWCPACRLQRRLAFRNQRSLYRRRCDKCGKSIISFLSDMSPMTVFCQECWWGDAWDPMSYGMKLDFGESFLSQFKNLFKAVPVINLFNTQSVNSDYCNFTASNKNSYLIFGGRQNEDLLYSETTSSTRDSLDLFNCSKLELSYENIQCENSNRLLFSKYSDNCSDSWFLYECKNCTNCFACTNLRGRSNCFFNEQLTKEEYEKRVRELNLGSYKALQETKQRFDELYRNALHRYAFMINTENSTGDNIRNARNCKNCFDISGTGSEDSRYTVYAVIGVKDGYDNYGMPHAERIYETIAIGFESNENLDYYFSFFIKGSARIFYSVNCTGCQDCFGCVGLRSKQYCILNRQYTKEEYESLLPKLIAHMNAMPYTDKKGRVYAFGEFFPVEFSPFAYNETIAQDYYPLTKEEMEARGLVWREMENKNYTVTVRAADLPDRIEDVSDSILNEVVGCAHEGKCVHQCTTAFKIIPKELNLYKQLGVPLPRLCPNCRHQERFSKRNPLKLWHRKCMCAGAASEKDIFKNTGKHTHGNAHCPNEFETPYAPERPEVIYCEQCYQAEVM